MVVSLNVTATESAVQSTLIMEAISSKTTVGYFMVLFTTIDPEVELAE